VFKAGLEFFYGGKKPVVLDVGGVSPGREGESSRLSIKGIFGGEAYALDLVFCREDGFIQGDGTRMPFRDEKFDMVSALDVLEHVPPGSRETFLQELCRVSRDLVLVSAPFADENTERAEKLLFDQVKTLYGLPHCQLEEHRQYGLPEREMVSGVLKKQAVSGTDFSYGSLESWIFFQSLRHCFIFQPESKDMNEVIDWFEIEHLKENEFRPPFSRHFWIASKSRKKQELEDGVSQILRALKSREEKAGKREESSLEKLEKFNRGLIRLFHPESVSAVIVAEAGGERLHNCLQNVLTQKVPFDLHVAVWNIGVNPDVEYMIKAFFPSIKYFEEQTEKAKPSRERLLEVFCQLKGDFILLVDEDVILPQDSTKKFYEKLRDKKTRLLLTPEMIQDESKSEEQLVETKPALVKGGCVFFRRKALEQRHWEEKLKGFFIWGARGEKR